MGFRIPSYPALDRGRPAAWAPGLSRRTLTDGIEAGALQRYGGLVQRSLLAARAGADRILCAATDPARNTPEDGLTVLHGLTAAISNGQLSLASARQSAARILALRR